MFKQARCQSGMGGVGNFVDTTCYFASCLVGENGKLGLWAVLFWGWLGGWGLVCVGQLLSRTFSDFLMWSIVGVPLRE